jgi:hypothetical protein
MKGYRRAMKLLSSDEPKPKAKAKANQTPWHLSSGG